MLPLLAAAPAQADTCGADGGRPCTVTERMPSCNLNLSESGGRGYRAACGAEGQRGCGPTERIMFDFILQLPVPPTARNGCCVSGTKGVVRIAQRLR